MRGAKARTYGAVLMRKTATARGVRRSGTARGAPGPLVVAAVDAFYRAEYATCAALLQARPSVSAQDAGWLELLRARVARIEDDVATWSQAATAAARLHPTAEGRLMALALQAAAAKRADRLHEATRLFDDVREQLARDPRTDTGETIYLLALDAWEDGDFERAERIVRAGLSIEGNRAERVALLAWIAVKREAYEAAGKLFRDAFEYVVADEPVDVRARARIMHGAVIVASETPALDLGRQLRSAYETTSFPSSLTTTRFHILAGLRVVALLEGDLEAAWIYARDAAAIAPSAQYAAMGETLAAATSLLLGERNAEKRQLARAWKILRGTTWAAADDEARVALTNFAIDGARTMPAEARKAITLYQSLRARAAPLNTLNDRRLTAFEAIAAARVSEALQRRDLAIAEYQRAFDLWNQLGYRVRAAEVALDLRRLGIAHETHEAAIATLLALAPKAWIYEEAQRAPTPVQGLTPAERAVLAELVLGHSAKTIAHDLERSHFTIINHTRRIFAVFGVRSRARLIARCVELGIVGEPQTSAGSARAAARNRTAERQQKRQQM
ncbi:MAG: LuxR C-terminal-related transcriptional regulator [Candidatus Baltobacteraceae bacterium]